MTRTLNKANKILAIPATLANKSIHFHMLHIA